MTAPDYLIDSNLCIAILNGASPEAARRLSGCGPGQLVTSTVVFGEVMLGAVLRDAIQPAKALFELIPPLPFDRPAAEAYARLPFKRGNFDRLIAAHALSLDLTLVTNNEADFADVPSLKVENWAR